MDSNVSQICSVVISVIVPGAIFSTVNIGGEDKTKVTYSITDGGVLDLDGISNNIIVDPVQLVSTAQQANSIKAPTTGFGKTLINNNFAETLLNIVGFSLIITTLGYTRLKK